MCGGHEGGALSAVCVGLSGAALYTFLAFHPFPTRSLNPFTVVLVCSTKSARIRLVWVRSISVVPAVCSVAFDFTLLEQCSVRPNLVQAR